MRRTRKCWYPNPEEDESKPWLVGWFHQWGTCSEIINEGEGLRGIRNFTTGLVEDHFTGQMLQILPEFIFFKRPKDETDEDSGEKLEGDTDPYSI